MQVRLPPPPTKSESDGNCLGHRDIMCHETTNHNLADSQVLYGREEPRHHTLDRSAWPGIQVSAERHPAPVWRHEKCLVELDLRQAAMCIAWFRCKSRNFHNMKCCPSAPCLAPVGFRHTRARGINLRLQGQFGRRPL